MSMQGKIDSSFTTEQRDLFASGIVAEIGVNAYAVWSAIKYHADFETGQAWPGMRRLGELVGLSKSAVDRAIDALEHARMLRVVKPSGKRRGQTYIARERLAVRIGSRTVCTVVLDYIPARLRNRLRKLEADLGNPQAPLEAFADVEIIPGDGFTWDPQKNALTGRLAASELPQETQEDTERLRAIGKAMLARIQPPKK